MASDPFERTPELQASEDKDKYRRAANTVRRFVRRSEEYRRPFVERAIQAKDLYSNWAKKSKSVIRRANLNVAYPFMLVQHEIPQLISPFFQDPLPFKLLGQSPEDAQFDWNLTQFLGVQFRQMNLRPRYVTHVVRNCIQGTSISKVFYRYQEKEVVDRQVVQEMDGSTSVMKSLVTKAVYDGPAYENVRIDDFYPDWAMTEPGEIQSMRGCVHRTFKTMEELKKNSRKVQDDGEVIGTYSNLDELEVSVHARATETWKPPYWTDSATDMLDEESYKKALAKPIEIWEYWGLFDPKNDGSLTECLITVANGDVCIRLERNPYDYSIKPFVASVNIPCDGEWYGLSELMPVGPHIKELTALRNARLDNVNISVNRMWKASRTAGINPNALVSRPDGIIWTNDMNGIEPVQAPNLPADVHKEIADLGAEVQQISGASTGPNVNPLAKVFGRSAAGVNYMADQSNNRIAIKLLLMADLHWAPLVKLMLSIDAQYVTETQYSRVMSLPGNPFIELPVDAFHTDYDFEVLPAIFSNPQQEQANLQLGMQFLQIVEQSQPGTVAWQPFFEDMGHVVFGRRLNRFIRSPQEAMQMQAQKLAAEQAANAQTGMNAPQPNQQQAMPGAATAAPAQTIDPRVLKALILGNGGGGRE